MLLFRVRVVLTLICRLTIRLISLSLSIWEVGAVWIVSPSRRTVMVSQISKISSRRWEM